MKYSVERTKKALR